MLIDSICVAGHNRSLSTFAGFLLARQDILSSLTAKGASQIILVSPEEVVFSYDLALTVSH